MEMPGYEYHVPVLLNEVLDGLSLRPEGVYVDCTFGGGGHAREILSRLSPAGRLVGFDQDEDAKRNIPDDGRLLFIPSNFRHLQRFLRLHKIGPVDGILADLGVSSFQFDEAARGFSTRFDGEMDMRMDKRQTLKAWDIIRTYPEDKLHKIFEQYGEVTNAKTLAKTISAARGSVSMQTISNFKSVIQSVVKGNPNKYFAQVFQALRIVVNDEMGALKEMLQQVPALLKPGGRVAIISFHSIEDRIVKNFFRKGDFEEQEENPFQQDAGKKNALQIITKKPVTASEREIKINPRSRSAKLRVAERTSE